MADIDIATITAGTVDSGDDLLGVARPANVARLFSVSSIITLAQTFANPLLAPAGSASLPAFSFTGDPNTGIYSSAANTIGLSTDGTLRASLSNTAFTSTVPFVAGLGDAFKIDNSRYFGTSAGSNVFITANGGSSGTWVVSSTANYAMRDDIIGWSASPTSTTTAPDTALSRQAAAIIALTDGSTGGAAMLFREQSAPTGVANSAIVYAVDNGSGKTRLMAIFGSGAAQQLAIEP